MVSARAQGIAMLGGKRVNSYQMVGISILLKICTMDQPQEGVVMAYPIKVGLH